MPLSILVVDRWPPLTDQQGTELIARALFPILRRGHRLTLLAPVSGDAEAARRAMSELFDEVHLVPRERRLTSLVGSLEPSLGRRGLRLGPMRWPVDPDAARRFSRVLREILASGRHDVVHVRQLPMAGYRRDIGRSPRLLELVDSETLASARDPRRSVRGRIRRRLAPILERNAIRGYDAVTLVADADAAAVQALDPNARVEVIPNGVDVDRFRPDPAARPEPGSIVFVGAMSFPPNVAAVRWFADDVFGRIVDRLPSARLTIVGRDPVPAIQALATRPRIAVTGPVDDVRPYLARAAVVVVPMVSGSGIKNKVLEALAMGRPVVATTLAAEGLAMDPGRDLAVADGAEAFAAATVGLLTDPSRADAFSAAGRAAVVAGYTWDVAAARYAALYDELARGRRK